ncbi:MAG: lysophospholipid acyltransferase family protein [Smithellaceae bacterium]|nr:1-acyl-sn-glycerol-3-phosphate acyltransferase [Syntrophaceae bacterium]MDD4240296.1 lysophospholipid acyltransferase family protein [Smithellaceae bacterium]NLX50978.1 1-acyl-sn-glycerol-3-phosphate acyltransferase [Deltaproteobacteria bacterium]
MIRSALLVTLGVAITAFFSFWAVVFSFFSNAENNVHKVANIWGRILLLLCGTKVQVIGRENILHAKPQVFMSNHQSDFDILIVLAHVPGQFRWIAKKELFTVPVFGQAMRSAGYIEIDRQNHEKALQSLDLAALRIREGKSVMTFPEGTRSRTGEIKAFKPGTFYLAIQSGAPIVPISIIGSGNIMPKRSLKIKPGKIKLVIDKPISTKDYTLDTRQALIDRVRQIIIKNYDAYRDAGTASLRDVQPEMKTAL